MLKFNYDKQGTVLESVADSIEDVINRQMLMAVRTTQPIYLEPSFVSLVVPSQSFEVKALETELAQVECDAVALCTVDAKQLDLKQGTQENLLHPNIEVIMRGFWLTHHPEAKEGLFVTSLTSGIEEHIEELWSYQSVVV